MFVCKSFNRKFFAEKFVIDYIENIFETQAIRWSRVESHEYLRLITHFLVIHSEHFHIYLIQWESFSIPRTYYTMQIRTDFSVSVEASVDFWWFFKLICHEIDFIYRWIIPAIIMRSHLSQIHFERRCMIPLIHATYLVLRSGIGQQNQNYWVEIYDEYPISHIRHHSSIQFPKNMYIKSAQVRRRKRLLGFAPITSRQVSRVGKFKLM